MPAVFSGVSVSGESISVVEMKIQSPTSFSYPDQPSLRAM